VVAYFAKRGNNSNARAIVEAQFRPEMTELPLLYPVTTEIDKDHDDYRSQITTFYEESAEKVAEHLQAGKMVAVLSEGDPLFYGSYMHLHVRLAHRFPTEVIPGVTAMSGCWSQTGIPIVQGDDVLTVLPGTMSEFELTRRLADTDAAVIMKVGRNLPKIRRALEATAKLSRAVYVERGTMAGSVSMKLADKPDDKAPYFAIVLVAGWSGRPGAVGAQA
ncbi:precorrin-2 C(20)-methyltransferase, partial [Mesorhizobium sp. M7A.F.Ca.CA.004.05.2.1]